MSNTTDTPISPTATALATDSSRNGDSHFLRVSIRAWIALILVATVCYMALAALPVEEPLYSLATLAVGFYFGQKASAGVTTKNQP